MSRATRVRAAARGGAFAPPCAGASPPASCCVVAMPDRSSRWRRRRCASPAPSIRNRSIRTRWRCSTRRASSSQIYESLVIRDRNFAIEPSLAVSWQQIDAEDAGASSCGPNVKFHDGTPFTADDVVFSIERALAKNSQRAFQLRGVPERARSTI